jgi:hypothetical protein
VSQPTPEPRLLPPLDDFVKVREVALRALRDSKRQSERDLKSLYTTTRLHYWLVAVGGYLLGIVALVPPLGRLIALGLPADAGWIAFGIALIIWTLIIAPLSGGVRRVAKDRSWPILLYTLIGIPVLIAVAEGAVRNQWSGVLQQVIVLPVYSLVILMLLFAILVTTSGSIPELLFLLLTSMRAEQGGRVIPSYEALTSDMLNVIKTTTASYSTERIEQINAVAQQKLAGLSNRLGTLELVFGIFALIGLIQLALVQEEVTAGINALFQSLLNFVGLATTVPSGLSGILVIGAILVMLVIGGLRYAARAYRELRLLDVVCLACTLRFSAETKRPPQAAHHCSVAPPQPLTVGRRELSFEQIEAIIGADLPKSARTYSAWWANETKPTHFHALAWLETGWRVEHLDLSSERVVFRHGNLREQS